jgi:predicted PurR-regulated permease PerM
MPENKAKASESFRTGEPPWDRMLSLGTRLFVWCVIFALLYLLRSFFLLVFLTFVFSYIQSHGVHLLVPRLKNRALCVVLVGLAFLGIVIGIGSFLTPRVAAQAALFAEKYPSYLQTIDKELSLLRERHSLLLGFLLQSKEPEAEAVEVWSPSKSTTASVVQQLLGFGEVGEADKNLNHALGLLRNVGQNVVAITSAFLLSLLFSFLIVLDLPKLTRSVAGLSDTKLGFIYEEVAENIRNFGLVLGRALEAQLIIALCNTMLTAVLIQLMGLGTKMAFLSIIVFLCSFIPVAGVFISSVPICLVALQELGISGVLLAVLAIWIIHLTETYVLNPRIFGSHLRINPVLVLVILTIAGKLFHVWGLVLGVPVCTYFFGYAIRYQAEKNKETSPAKSVCIL